MRSLTLALLLLMSFRVAAADSAEKPDEFARKHWSASAAPVVYDEPAAPVIKKPAYTPPPAAVIKNGEFPKVAVCEVGSLSSHYLISDSDGVDACAEHGGQIVAGRDEDRKLMNVKDSIMLKRAKK
jgi:hypothetical protein